jgi:hypothetical protein
MGSVFALVESFRTRSSSISRSSLVLDFFFEVSADSEVRLDCEEVSPLRRDDPVADRESGSADLPVILFHIVFWGMFGGRWLE